MLALDWPKKCTFLKCSSCQDCFPAGRTPQPPPAPPHICADWCEIHAAHWEYKCFNFNVCTGCSACSTSPPPAPPPNLKASRIKPHTLQLPSNIPIDRKMELTWSDEFDDCPGGRPDEAVWTYEEGWVRNGEMQYYRKDNAQCKDGRLVITALQHKHGIENPHMQDSLNASKNRQCSTAFVSQRPKWCHTVMDRVYYTSSSLQTRPEKTGLLTTGQYDARIRFPPAANAWPAWWAIGSKSGLGTGHGTRGAKWPQDGEIDILEYHTGRLFMALAYATDAADIFAGDAAWLPDTAGEGLPGVSSMLTPEWGTQFHNYSLIWTDTGMDFFLDGMHLVHAELSAIDEDAKPYNPYNGFGFNEAKANLAARVPVLLKLNMAIPDEGEWFHHGRNVPVPVWPLVMEVEYVRHFRELSPSPPPQRPHRPPFPPGPDHPPQPQPPPPPPIAPPPSAPPPGLPPEPLITIA